MKHTLSTILLFVSATILCASCDSTQSPEPVKSPLLTLSANMAQPVAPTQDATQQLASLFGTEKGITPHTTIDADSNPHTLTWSQRDLICVHFDTDPEGVMRLYSLSEGAGTTSGNFTYSRAMSINPDIAYDQIPALPASYNTLLAGYNGLYTQITLSDQDVILQTPLEIFLGLESVEDFPMIGSAQAGQPISFHCPFGLVHIPVTGNIAIEKINFDTSDQQQEIAGYFVIDQTTYLPSFHSQAVVQSQFSITWASSGANGTQLSDTPLDFYVVLPPGTYEAGTLLKFQTPDGSTFEKKTLMPFTVNRAEILNLPTIYVGQ